MAKVIIGIHGLGNKPPKNLLKLWWMQSISEGLKKLNVQNRQFDFKLVYRVDIFNKTPILPEETSGKNSDSIKKICAKEY